MTIIRERAGIPHILARNFIPLGYGEGFVSAQDNLCTFANDVVTVKNGTRSADSCAAQNSSNLHDHECVEGPRPGAKLDGGGHCS